MMGRPSPVPSSWSQESRGTWSCHLTARHGVQLFADVNVTLHVVLESSFVEYAAPVQVEPGMNKTPAQREHLARDEPS